MRPSANSENGDRILISRPTPCRPRTEGHGGISILSLFSGTPFPRTLHKRPRGALLRRLKSKKLHMWPIGPSSGLHRENRGGAPLPLAEKRARTLDRGEGAAPTAVSREPQESSAGAPPRRDPARWSEAIGRPVAAVPSGVQPRLEIGEGFGYIIFESIRYPPRGSKRSPHNGGGAEIRGSSSGVSGTSCPARGRRPEGRPTAMRIGRPVAAESRLARAHGVPYGFRRRPG